MILQRKFFRSNVEMKEIKFIFYIYIEVNGAWIKNLILLVD